MLTFDESKDTTFSRMSKCHRRPRAIYRYWYLLLLVQAVLLGGCAGRYFRSAGKPPWPPPCHTLAQWPYQEYWTGIVFNGTKIGFTRLSLSPSEGSTNRFDVRCEASMQFRFLMLDKKVVLKSYDLVADDLSLESFSYDYNMDGNRQRISGKLSHDKLEVEMAGEGQSRRQVIPVQDKLYPASIIYLYPVLYGLEVGRHYSYKVYDGETQSVATVTQEILAYEESDLFSGKAFKVKTRLHGQQATAWIDARGRPLLEMSLHGVMISSLESEQTAKDYLSKGAINKDEALLNYSLIRSKIAISEPERVTFMEVVLSGLGQGLSVPTSEEQQCERRGDDEVFCRIITQRPAATGKPHAGKVAQAMQYLQPSYAVPCRNPIIRRKAREITQDTKETLERIRLLAEWMRKNIERKPMDVFSALDVLARGKAECQGHTFLYAALARALDIPTRVVNGIVYSSRYQGFVYHTWAESLVNGGWFSVDPTLGQLPADATHIKLVEGETLSDLVPLVDLIGRLSVHIMSLYAE
ncbi:MAG: transglutaminase domain-containing protein [Desulfobacterales bacterium]|nr:transglutaminase domain-containing protein [Desulfobacterales bacterium]